MIYEYKGKKPKIGKNVYIAATAAIIGNVTIKDGANIWFGAVLRGDLAPIEVGKNTNIQDNCTIHVDEDRPVVIGDNVTIGHNAVVHGCTVENYSLVGIGAIALNGALIRSYTVVAAGALVREDQVVGPGQLVAGVPAVMKKQFEETELELLKMPSKIYTNLAGNYLSE